MSKPVWEKLNLNDSLHVALFDVPPNYYQLIEWPGEVFKTEPHHPLDWVHIFDNKQSSLCTTILAAKRRLTTNGVIWVSYYKKSSGKNSEVTGNFIRSWAKTHGLVDNKICSIGQNWTACRLVIPLKLRA